jgi:hypothetical protein
VSDDTDNDDDLLSIANAARRLGITTEDCHHLVNSGRLRSVVGAAGQRLVPGPAIAAWL